jgi:hypothetical protein
MSALCQKRTCDPTHECERNRFQCLVLPLGSSTEHKSKESRNEKGANEAPFRIWFQFCEHREKSKVADGQILLFSVYRRIGAEGR